MLIPILVAQDIHIYLGSSLKGLDLSPSFRELVLTSREIETEPLR